MSTGRSPACPVIGLPAATTRPAGSPARVGQSRAYVDALSRAGAAPLLIPPQADEGRLRALYDRVDGILLPGGPDVDPVHYGQPPHETARIVPERDATELPLARWAVAEARPLLAICRGIQVLNVALGGSLYQDIADLLPQAGKHDWYPGYARDLLAHTVTVTAPSRLAEIVGAGELPVNSRHHQALAEAAPGLVVVARAPDGVIEAVEAPDHPFALGVQWHPELLAEHDPRAQALFDALVRACRA